MDRLPQGTVTLLFTDIEGSTRLLRRLGDRYGDMLADHQRLLRAAFAMHGGVEVDTQGDAFLIAFARAPDAVAAAVDALRALAAHQWPDDADLRVRMGLHTGAPTPRADGTGYTGIDVHRAARIAAVAHGGQILLSAATLALSAHTLSPGMAVRDLGTHRLKDIAQSERLYQLEVAGLLNDFPPPMTLDARPNNLPVQATPLIGREREVAAVADLLRGAARLITLTGPGGTGKTRLALAAAAELLGEFSDGTWFVPLAALIDPALVASAIAGALHLQEAGGEPLAETLTGYLRGREALLVLDNFEQVADAAPLVGELLAACPGVRVLATSRAPLQLYGEHEYSVAPLALPGRRPPPSAEQLPQYEAVRLFIERAQAVKSDFKVTNANAPAVAEICHQLDGLPLAIELAAARVRMLPPEALLARLESRLTLLTGGTRDVPARQRTLRGAIDWSYDLLDTGGRALFRRLAVFAGGGTLEAIAAVCDAGGGGPPGSIRVDILDGVEALASNSLLRPEEDGEGGEPRFDMLETIREYAAEQLEESGEAQRVRTAHAAYFLALAENAEPELSGPRQGAWLARLEEEHDNLRAALTWTFDRGERQIGLRLAAALAHFWDIRGHLIEGRRHLDAALATTSPVQSAVRGTALAGAGLLAVHQGDISGGLALGERALTLFREIGDMRGIAAALKVVGTAAHYRGDYASSERWTREALEIHRELGDAWGVARALNNLGAAALDTGDLARYRPPGGERRDFADVGRRVARRDRPLKPRGGPPPAG